MAGAGGGGGGGGGADCMECQVGECLTSCE